MIPVRARRGLAGLAAATLAVVSMAGCAPPGGGAVAIAPGPKPAATSPAVVAAVQQVLDRRSEAVLTRDSAAYAATIGPAATQAQRAAQLAELADSADLSFHTFALRLDPASMPPPGGAWTVPVQLSYTLAGWDTRPVTLPRTLTLARVGTGWAVTADSSRDAPWDFGPVTATADGPALVLAHPASLAAARRIAATAASAVPVVTRAWGADWPRRVVVVLPASVSELEAEVGTTADLSTLAAVQTVELPGGSAAAGTGDRILINPTEFLQRTSTLGQQVVLTHEITHVASRASTTAGVPLWLVEGLADTVAFATTDLTPAQGAPELAAAVRAGSVPAALPTDADFAPGARDAAAVYEQAWLACRLIAARVGVSGLVRLYRAVGAGDSLTIALRDQLHTTPALLTTAWQAALRSELG